jgi:hypothetical protein
MSQPKSRKIAILGSRSVGESVLGHAASPLSPCLLESNERIAETRGPYSPAPRATGKSSLAVQYVDGHFVESYYPTIENTFSKIIRHKNQEFQTEIIDTAGQDEYSILNSKHVIGIHGYMVVYSISSRVSFDMVTTIREKILNHLVRLCYL